MGVWIHPGTTALTRMPALAHSRAAAFVSPMTPCLLAALAETPREEPTNPYPDDMLTMAPPPCVSICRNLGLHAQPYAFQIDTDDTVKVRFGQLDDGRLHPDARIVKRIIQTAIHCECPLDHSFDRICLRHISLDKEGLASRFLNHLDGFFAFGYTTRGNDHPGAFPGKRRSGRTSYAGVSPCD
jgi:hypothetical protein